LPLDGPLLSIEGLRVEFASEREPVRALDGVDFEIGRGEIVAVVGESGSGKSVTALSLMGLLPRAANVTGGRAMFEGRDLLKMSSADLCATRGREIGMIFQDPMTSLNPTLTVGFQIGETLREHLGYGPAQARARALELLKLVGISEAESRLDQYPHQFSGGMRQRVMIAIGLACQPKLLIADEPTTALDVTVQAQILDLMSDLVRKLGASLLIITHNLGVVARYADRVVVMYSGRIAERGEASAVFMRPRHFYTAGLLNSAPRLDSPVQDRLDTIEGQPPDPSRRPAGCAFAPRCPHRIAACAQPRGLEVTDTGTLSACARIEDIAAGHIRWGGKAHEVEPDGEASEEPPILRAENLVKHYTLKAGWRTPARVVKAVDGVSLSIRPGQTIGLVGESGCGKSTLGRMILRLDDPTSGRIEIGGRDATHAKGDDLRQLRRLFQVVFQDPYASLNPRKTIREAIAEPMRVHGIASGPRANARVAELLEQVGLRPDMAERYPHQMSGGQRQRVGIARALAMQPKLIICDEAVSALDVSIQAQVVNLLSDLKRSMNLSYLFIAHDLAVVRHIADEVLVMYLGRIVERAPRDVLYARPQHPYTRMLLAAAPSPDPAREKARSHSALIGEPPSPFAPPPGCAFAPRCPLATDECRAAPPPLRETGPAHQVACLRIDA
jgi:peptide/nickel transport system ATP-binding protein